LTDYVKDEKISKGMDDTPSGIWDPAYERSPRDIVDIHRGVRSPRVADLTDKVRDWLDWLDNQVSSQTREEPAALWEKQLFSLRGGE
jgi:hypothetical protein